ncbi:MAG: thymidylate synthase [Patescibacteria group bacterium]|nr:thymidylate synthase [Patescibacteria group bacterium]MDE1944471.1 thymidylate synthase [Patescibacteria group bacterium]MDE1944772.1 thymidylate synthase [Patescibacteria group bacterium]MDE2057225.1 thymidylate synthase [Patescibacteria group bacterium]
MSGDATHARAPGPRYKTWGQRKPDRQYRDRLRHILDHGVLAKTTPQGVGALTCFGTLPSMVFPIENGVPLITERRLPSWRQAIAEIIAFINGARTLDDLERYGCRLWNGYRTWTEWQYGLPFGDLGPGSYGAVFHDYPTTGGERLNQLANVVEQIQQHPHLRTHRVTNWRPDMTAEGAHRKVLIAPCHGEMHFRVLNGQLNLIMNQRSGDMPLGVPHNMIQYAALLLMVAQVTGYAPGTYVHGLLGDIHVYEDQVPLMHELLQRPTGRFPILRLDPSVTDLFDFRAKHFTLEEYDEAGPTLPGIPFSL